MYLKRGRKLIAIVITSLVVLSSGLTPVLGEHSQSDNKQAKTNVYNDVEASGNDFDTAVEVSDHSEQPGYLLTPSEADYYKFTATVNGFYSIIPETTDFTAQVTLYSADHNELGYGYYSNYYSNFTGSLKDLASSLEAGKTYYVRVSYLLNPHYGDIAELNYALKINPILHWSLKCEIPQGISPLGNPVKTGDKTYVIDRTGSKLYQYEPSTNTWTAKIDLPSGVINNANLTEANGKLYLTGGSGSMWEYNANGNLWIQRANMPTGRGNVGVASLNGKIYTIGGTNFTSGYPTQTVEVYDPNSNTWSTEANMLDSKNNMRTAVVNGKIYVIGGIQYWDGYSNMYTVEEFDPNSHTWTAKNSMPGYADIIQPAVAVLNGKIYVMGGYLGITSYASNLVQEYDPANDVWTTKGNMIFSGCGSAVATQEDGKIYILGGTTSNNRIAIQVYNP